MIRHVTKMSNSPFEYCGGQGPDQAKLDLGSLGSSTFACWRLEPRYDQNATLTLLVALCIGRLWAEKCDPHLYITVLWRTPGRKWPLLCARFAMISSQILGMSWMSAQRGQTLCIFCPRLMRTQSTSRNWRTCLQKSLIPHAEPLKPWTHHQVPHLLHPCRHLKRTLGAP